MRKDFSKRELPTILDKVAPHTDCDCVDCKKSAIYGNQIARRLTPFRSAVMTSKNNHFLEPHHSDVDSLDSSIIGSYVTSKKPINLYKEMGGSVSRVVSPDRMVGRVTAINSKGNWLYVNDVYSGENRFVNVTNDLVFSKPQPLTEKQKSDAIITAISGNSPILGKTIEVGDKIGTSISGFLGVAKWYLIAVLVIIIIGVFLRIKG
jgi:hypothetical protein